jgi:hypothetical protein
LCHVNVSCVLIKLHPIHSIVSLPPRRSLGWLGRNPIAPAVAHPSPFCQFRRRLSAPPGFRMAAKDGGGGAFFPFSRSSPVLFPLEWCCYEHRGPLRRWLARPFLHRGGRIRGLVDRIWSSVPGSGGCRARLPATSCGWDAVVAWSGPPVCSSPVPSLAQAASGQGAGGGRGRHGGAAVRLESVHIYRAASWPLPLA